MKFFLGKKFLENIFSAFSDNLSVENAFFVKINPLNIFKNNKFLSDSFIYTEMLSDRYKPT